MREMTASEAARSFAAALDGAENGETVVITRAGKRVATLGPAPQANGAAVLELMARWSGKLEFSDTFDDDLRAIREVPAELDSDPWRD